MNDQRGPMMVLHRSTVYLNCTLGSHLVEDAEAVVVYIILPAEPDVGIFHQTADFGWLETIKGRSLDLITKKLSDEQIEKIMEQVS